MKKNKNAVLILLNYGIVVALLLMIAIFSFTSKNFFRTSTMFTILKQVSITGIVCIGQTMVMLTGGIDLSVGSVAGVSAVTAAIFLKSYNLPIPVTCILVLILSLIYGLISGFCVTKLNMPPLIATLGVQTLGRYLYGVGGNEEASRLSGIGVTKIKLMAYGLSGFLAGIAGLVLLSRTSSGQPSAGSGYEMDAITAVVLGGVSLNGGEGKLHMVVIGMLIMGVLTTGMIMCGINDYVQQFVKGIVLILAVAYSEISKKIRSRMIVTE